MCLAIPGKVLEIINNTGIVEIGDVKLKVGLDLLPEVAVNDYVLIHAGFAIQLIDKEAALETWELIKELAEDEYNKQSD